MKTSKKTVSDETRSKPILEWTDDDFYDLICCGCQFYDPEEEKLQCGAFIILVDLLKQGTLAIDQVEGSSCARQG